MKARTVFDLSPEALRTYQPWKRARQTHQPERLQRAWTIARKAQALLREEFSAERVVVFGSLVRGSCFNQRSDIDLVAWGIQPHEFYGAVAAVSGISSEFTIDLIDPDTCPDSLLEKIERYGVEL